MEPLSGVAVRTTFSVFLKFALQVEQVEPHSMRRGDEVTVPEPRPDLVTVRVERFDERGNVTVSAMIGVS